MHKVTYLKLKALIIALLIIGMNAFARDSIKLVINFNFNQHQLTPTAIKIINDKLGGFPSNHLITSIVITGHTDQIGSNKYNEKLSLQRATATRQYLETLLKDKHIEYTIDFWGKSRLLTNLMSEEEREKNRRVEIVIYYHSISDITEVATLPMPTPLAVNPQPKPIVEQPKPNEEPPKKIAEIFNDTAIKVGSQIELPYILFQGGMHRFLPQSIPYLQELLKVMQDNENLEIEIQGHICCVPGDDDGEDYETHKNNLSVERAKAVYEYLQDNGIKKRRMSYKGYGHQYPKTQERNAQEQQRNRRVEILILNK